MWRCIYSVYLYRNPYIDIYLYTYTCMYVYVCDERRTKLLLREQWEKNARAIDLFRARPFEFTPIHSEARERSVVR